MSDTQPAPFVRPYDATRDFDAGCHVFHETINPALAHEPALTLGSFLWYKPYVTLSPSTCFILDNGHGLAVGYIIGTPDTSSFSTKWKTHFIPILDPTLVPHPSTDTTNTKEDDEIKQMQNLKWIRELIYDAKCSLLLANPAVLEKYPAHFHIDILPSHQRQGWGKVLINTFLEKIKEEGAKGVQLDMFEGNADAGRFYESLGFRRCKEVLDGGVSGETGKEGQAVCLVREI